MKQSQIQEQIGKTQIFHICFSVYNNHYLFVGTFKLYMNELINKIAKDKKIKIYNYKIMPNHIHILLEKNKKQFIPIIVQYLKGVSAFKFFKMYPGLKRDMKTLHLWTSGYWAVEILNEKQFINTFDYIKNNDKELIKIFNKYN